MRAQTVFRCQVTGEACGTAFPMYTCDCPPCRQWLAIATEVRTMTTGVREKGVAQGGTYEAPLGGKRPSDLTQAQVSKAMIWTGAAVLSAGIVSVFGWGVLAIAWGAYVLAAGTMWDQDRVP